MPENKPFRRGTMSFLMTDSNRVAYIDHFGLGGCSD
jgi:hypothetical protein